VITVYCRQNEYFYSIEVDQLPSETIDISIKDGYNNLIKFTIDIIPDEAKKLRDALDAAIKARTGE